MLDVVIFETAQHMDDGVNLTDIGEELVAQPFTLGRAAHEARNVDKAQLRLDNLLAAANLRDHMQPRIGHRDCADIGLDRAKGIIRRLRRLRLGQRVEQGGLAHIGQPDNTAFETHNILVGNELRAP
jgi:hypothetical protein